MIHSPRSFHRPRPALPCLLCPALRCPVLLGQCMRYWGRVSGRIDQVAPPVAQEMRNGCRQNLVGLNRAAVLDGHVLVIAGYWGWLAAVVACQFSKLGRMHTDEGWRMHVDDIASWPPNVLAQHGHGQLSIDPPAL